MSTADVARELRYSPKTVENWRFEGRGPKFIKLPTGTVRYRRSDVDAWIN